MRHNVIICQIGRTICVIKITGYKILNILFESCTEIDTLQIFPPMAAVMEQKR